MSTLENTDAQTPEEHAALAAVGTFVPVDDIRFCNRSIKPEDDREDVIVVDKKGFKVSDRTKKERMPFQPPTRKYRAIYDQGFRLAHTSFDNGAGNPKIVVHYWVNADGWVTDRKIKREVSA